MIGKSQTVISGLCGKNYPQRQAPDRKCRAFQHIERIRKNIVKNLSHRSCAAEILLLDAASPDMFGTLPRCGRGGIGRRAALRSLWGNPWKFESSRPHQKNPAQAGFFVFGQWFGWIISKVAF
jgi:hypothetical protein